MTTDIHTCDWQALLWRCSSSKNEEGETVSAADAELHLGQSRDQWGEVDHVFNILYKTVIIITATYHHQMSRCISVPGPWRQSDGPTSNIGYGLQIRRSNDTSSNIALIRMFHAHQSVSSSSASPSKLMHDISRELPAANPVAAEGEVSLSPWPWVAVHSADWDLAQTQKMERVAIVQCHSSQGRVTTWHCSSCQWMWTNNWGKIENMRKRGTPLIFFYQLSFTEYIEKSCDQTGYPNSPAGDWGD